MTRWPPTWPYGKGPISKSVREELAPPPPPPAFRYPTNATFYPPRLQNHHHQVAHLSINHLAQAPQAGLPQPPIPVSIGNNSFTMFLENIGLAKSTTTSATLGFSKLAIFVRKARRLNRHGNPAPPECTSTMRDLARPTKKEIYLYL